MTVPGLIEKVRVQFGQMLGVKPYPGYGEVKKPDYITTEIAGTRAEPAKPGVLGALVLSAVRSRTPGLVDVGAKVPS